MTYHYDVVIVGAGIQGVGVAQAAAAAGWKVGVLEANAVGAGTSSRSSKLIHGGLRYLEGGHLRLVRESLYERAVLLRTAPELVRLTPFHIPIYKDTRRGVLRIRLGLTLYSLLAGGGAAGRFDALPRSQWSNLDGLDTRGLRAVFRYFDAQTDDALLTRAVMQSAISLGAELHCPAQFVGARRDTNGIDVDYRTAGGVHTMRVRVLINAAGPWANRVLELVTPQVPMRPFDLVQGTHIVLPGRLAQGAYYVEAPLDRRGMFVLPWKDGILVGTTETGYTGDPAAVAPRADETEYLRNAVRHYFPTINTVPLRTFAGLRVLPRVDSTFSKRTRETLLQLDALDTPRIVTIYGGKLTGYRATAQRVLARVMHQLPERHTSVDTAQLRLTPPE